MFSEEQKEKMVQELMEIVRKRRKLRDSPAEVSDMLEGILKSIKEKEDKPDPYPVDWTALEALLSKFREEESCSRGLRVDEAKVDESKKMDFANVKLRLPCRFSHGEDNPPPPVVPWHLLDRKPNSPLQLKWKRNPNNAASSNKYRKGACENCGAMTHGLDSCMASSPKRGPKSTSKLFGLPDTEMVSIRVWEDLIWNLLKDDPETQSTPEDPLPDADPNDKFDGDGSQS